MSSKKRETIIVLVTAIITGLLAPLIVNAFQNRALERQKEHEALVTRQASIIQAQEKLLDTLSEEFVDYEFLAFKVSYYKQHNSEKQFEAAVKKYDEESWRFFQAIRAEVYRSSRLVTAGQYPRLLKFPALQGSIDGTLVELVRSKASSNEWSHFDSCLRGAMEKETPQMLQDVARDLKLTSPVPGETSNADCSAWLGLGRVKDVSAGSLESSFDFDKCMVEPPEGRR